MIRHNEERLIMKSILHTAMIAVLLFMGLCAAHAEKRVALIIGNSAYAEVEQLKNQKQKMAEERKTQSEKLEQLKTNNKLANDLFDFVPPGGVDVLGDS